MTRAILLTVLIPLPSGAQWLTQEFRLLPGWSAIYLHVDPSHEDLRRLSEGLPAEIEEIWQWNRTVPGAQSQQNPASPSQAGTLWSFWQRAPDPSLASSLDRLTGNTAYLVRVASAAPIVWRVKGRPVAPKYEWTTTGLNLIGLPTLPGSPPTFAGLFGPAESFFKNLSVHRYAGGALEGNPVKLGNLTVPVVRGEAYWMRSGDQFNRYFGPFELVQSDPKGLDFGTEGGRRSLRFRNLTGTNLTLRAHYLASEDPPDGQPAIVEAPPLLIRGSLNPTNLTFGFTAWQAESPERTWTLEPAGRPGSEVEIILGLNRTEMGEAPGSQYAGILRFEDSLGMTRMDVGVSGEVASTAGLWVGTALMQEVRPYLHFAAQGTNLFVRATNLVHFTNVLSAMVEAKAQPPSGPDLEEGPEAWKLKGTDLKHGSGLAGTLKEPETKVEEYLRGKLLPATLALLDAWDTDALPAPELESALLTDLNRILESETLWDEERFSGVPLRPATQALLASEPSGDALKRLNRLLLEDAFPREFSRKEIRYQWNPTTQGIQQLRLTDGQVVSMRTVMSGAEPNTTPQSVARPFPARLIVHQGAGAEGPQLFQQVFVGFDATTNGVASTRQDLLAPHLLHQARRISTVHLPVIRPNTGYPGSGRLGGHDPVSWLVGTSFSEHSSNPFLHTYHPDHDNLDDRDPLFVERAVKGDESYDITRRITLIRQDPEETFEALTRGSQTMEGRYEETITLKRADSERSFFAQGTFSLQRVLEVPTLLQP